mgnify:CR=1 FL=1
MQSNYFANIYKITSYADTEIIEECVKEACELHHVIRSWKPSEKRHVVIKPNWIQESHEIYTDVWESLITHPSIVESILKVISAKMGGEGIVSICDAPHTYANFSKILSRGNLKEKILESRKRWPKLDIKLIDLRREIWIRKEEVIVDRIANDPDPNGYVEFDLGSSSLFYKHPGEGKYYGADYDSEVVRQHHQGITQEYLLAGTPIICDFFINVPKLKTHKKTGVTCCLKNLVGINGDKNWLPHHTEGTPETGGDEFPNKSTKNKLEIMLKKLFQKLALNFPFIGGWFYRKIRTYGKIVLGASDHIIRNGNWHGNNTCWRMALDLNRCLIYGKSDGTFLDSKTRKPYLAIVDGIIGGQGNGPVSPEIINSEALITGDNPAVIDAISCQVMGFDPCKVPLVRESFDLDHKWPIAPCAMDKVTVFDGQAKKNVPLSDIRPWNKKNFKPHFGWVGFVEKNGS